MKALKAAAVISSLALVGGYVLFKSGGGLMPGSKSARIVRETSEVREEPATAPSAIAQPAPAEKPLLLPGSKSSAAFDAYDVVRAEPATQPGNQKQP